MSGVSTGAQFPPALHSTQVSQLRVTRPGSMHVVIWAPSKDSSVEPEALGAASDAHRKLANRMWGVLPRTSPAD